MSREPSPPSSLNERRDRYVQAMRALAARICDETPVDLKGILGRTEDLVGQQLPVLDELGRLDLESGDAVRPTVEVLMRAQRLPRMLLCLGEVLLQQERSTSLRPAQHSALALARELAALAEEWVERHREQLEAFDPLDGEDDELDDDRLI